MSKHGYWLARCGELECRVSAAELIERLALVGDEAVWCNADCVRIGEWVLTRGTP